ncbi:hypothetical protein BDV95DRAFT_603305 [Massariosphaeria phaeospora]|uniref:RING-type domain-containing protein n=1 Tax=Massariosphaeria phaeospora TaxID=100035 RepID=A0A7C8IC90_9PLEO|nr:hypothetical protein BDV95DRAFT_603305 [Massariosphaeria phaeospora]
MPNSPVPFEPLARRWVFIRRGLSPVETPDPDEACPICQSTFGEVPENVVCIDRCNHKLHRECLVRWLHSVAERRNTCPSCRAELCHPEVLEPLQLALLLKDTDPTLNRWNFEDIMIQTDRMFFIELSRGQNFVPIAGRFLDWFHDAMEDCLISLDHARAGDRWIRYVVTRRIESLVHQEGLDIYPSGIALLALHEQHTRQLFRIPEAVEHGDPQAGPQAAEFPAVPTAEPQAEQQVAPQGEQDVELQENPEAEPQADQVQADPEVEPLANPEVEAQANLEVEAGAHRHLQARVDDEVEAQADPDVDVQANPHVDIQEDHAVEGQANEVEAEANHDVEVQEDPNSDAQIEGEVEAPADLAMEAEAEQQVDHESEESPVPTDGMDLDSEDREIIGPIPTNRYPGRRERREHHRRPPTNGIRRLNENHRQANRRRLQEARTWLEQRNHVIVSELRNVGATSRLGGGRGFRVRHRNGQTLAVVRDAEAFVMVGDHTIFYRFGE